jgi:hypothetical protein
MCELVGLNAGRLMVSIRPPVNKKIVSLISKDRGMIEEERLSITFGSPLPKEYISLLETLPIGGAQASCMLHSFHRQDGWMDHMWTQDTLFVVFMSPC